MLRSIRSVLVLFLVLMLVMIAFIFFVTVVVFRIKGREGRVEDGVEAFLHAFVGMIRADVDFKGVAHGHDKVLGHVPVMHEERLEDEDLERVLSEDRMEDKATERVDLLDILERSEDMVHTRKKKKTFEGTKVDVCDHVAWELDPVMQAPCDSGQGLREDLLLEQRILPQDLQLVARLGQTPQVLEAKLPAHLAPQLERQSTHLLLLLLLFFLVLFLLVVLLLFVVCCL